MCTAATYHTKDHYFGRNLDYEFSYHETVTITPRHKHFSFRHQGDTAQHYAMIGMAFVLNDYPLYYDATNEKGLSIAGLNFPDNAHYFPVQDDKTNVASFELIPWLLGSCATIEDVKAKLETINITNDAFSDELPPSPLHWMIADQKQVIVFEQTADGGKVYDNPFGVMTNNPTFDYHLTHIQDYLHTSAAMPQNTMAKEVETNFYSRGMGGIGIPGDLSSASRFVKVAFTKMNAVSGDSEEDSVTQFFKILGSVEQQKGCCFIGTDDKGQAFYEHTIYSSCCNIDQGIYYYTTYHNPTIIGIDMYQEDLDSEDLISYELEKETHLYLANQK